MTRIQLRLAGFAVVLTALFGGGYAVGSAFPTDPAPAHESPAHEMDDDGVDLHGSPAGTDPSVVGRGAGS